jgi:hypothetical protein
MSIASTPRATMQPTSARWALTRIAARRLVTHPLLVLGMLTWVAALTLANSDVFERSSDAWLAAQQRWSALLALALLTLAWASRDPARPTRHAP